ncbi:MAG TPA: hypothetical protein VK254_02830 [Candidatus Bathyarchaeia archaeon]|nr:hypothetical protein [Candidatus Bathyarchaeia archaeon]
MTVIIKKISRKTAFSVAVIFGAFLAFALRLFFGTGHINLSKLNSNEKNPLNSEEFSIIHPAKADVTSGDSTGGSGSDGGSDGCGSG